MALIDKVRVIKLLLFALFMMVSMVTPAQSQVDWSIKAGIGMANIIGDNMGSPKVKLAYKLGIGLECPFDKIWSLQTGVSFVSKGTNHTIVETDGISAQAKVNASYLELPVMVAARFASFRLWSGDRFIGGIPALCDRSGRTIRAVQTSKRTSREEYYRLCNSGI